MPVSFSEVQLIQLMSWANTTPEHCISRRKELGKDAGLSREASAGGTGTSKPGGDSLSSCNVIDAVL